VREPIEIGGLLGESDAVRQTSAPEADGRERAASAGPSSRPLRGAACGLSVAERLNRRWNTDIGGQTTLEGILRVCQSNGSQLSLVNAVTALHRLAKTPEEGAQMLQSTNLLQVISVAVEASLPDVGSVAPRQLSNSLWALAKMLVDSDTPLLHAIAAASMRSLT